MVVVGCLSVKRIVCGDVIVIVELEYFVQQIVYVVSGIGIGIIVNRDVEFVVGVKMYVIIIMDGVSYGIQFKDNFFVVDDGVVFVGCYVYNVVVIVVGYGIVKVDVVVLFEVGMKYQFFQVFFIEVVDFQVNKRIWQQDVVFYNLNVFVFFCNKNMVIGGYSYSSGVEIGSNLLFYKVWW